MTTHDSSLEEQEATGNNPQQFRLLDLFALMTLVAVVSAMAAPILSGLESEYRSVLLLVIGLQFLIVIWSIVHYAKKRMRLLDEAGAKIGFGFCGQMSWQHWPVAKTIISILYHSLAQLVVAICISVSVWITGVVYGPFSVCIDRLPVPYRVMEYLYILSFLDYVLPLGISWDVGHSFSRFRWRAYPGAIEFFEQGIVQRGLVFTPWKHVEVRPSALYEDKIAVVLRGGENSIVATTHMAQVTGELRKRVFAAANATETA